MKSAMRLVQILGVMLALPAFLAACAPAAAKPAFPIGTFHPVNVVELSTLTFRADGKYTTDEPSGRYVVTGDTIVFTEDFGGCIGTPGTYTWSFDGSKITFKLVKDDCPRRVSDWTSGAWIKQP